MENNDHYIFHAQRLNGPHGFLAYVETAPKINKMWQGEEIHFNTDRSFRNDVLATFGLTLYSEDASRLRLRVKSRERHTHKYAFHQAFKGAPKDASELWRGIHHQAHHVDALKNWTFDDKGHNCNIACFYILQSVGLAPPHNRYEQMVSQLATAIAAQKQDSQTATWTPE